MKHGGIPVRNEQQAQRLAILNSATAQRLGSKQTYATMRKSALIATCLTHSAMVPDVNAGEAAVRQVFEENFPCECFESWNSLIIGSVATAIINGVGRAARIRVDLFIVDLWESPGSETME
jgi:hypothetical protein